MIGRFQIAALGPEERRERPAARGSVARLPLSSPLVLAGVTLALPHCALTHALGKDSIDFRAGPSAQSWGRTSAADILMRSRKSAFSTARRPIDSASAHRGTFALHLERPRAALSWFSPSAFRRAALRSRAVAARGSGLGSGSMRRADPNRRALVALALGSEEATARDASISMRRLIRLRGLRPSAFQAPMVSRLAMPALAVLVAFSPASFPGVAPEVSLTLCRGSDLIPEVLHWVLSETDSMRWLSTSRSFVTAVYW